MAELPDWLLALGYPLNVKRELLGDLGWKLIYSVTPDIVIGGFIRIGDAYDGCAFDRVNIDKHGIFNDGDIPIDSQWTFIRYRQETPWNFCKIYRHIKSPYFHEIQPQEPPKPKWRKLDSVEMVQAEDIVCPELAPGDELLNERSKITRTDSYVGVKLHVTCAAQGYGRGIHDAAKVMKMSRGSSIWRLEGAVPVEQKLNMKAPRMYRSNKHFSNPLPLP